MAISHETTLKRVSEIDLQQPSSKKQKKEDCIQYIQQAQDLIKNSLSNLESLSLPQEKISPITEIKKANSLLEKIHQMATELFGETEIQPVESYASVFSPSLFLKKLEKGINQTNHEKIKNLIESLFDTPGQLKSFLEFITKDYLNYCFILLKHAYLQSKPAVFLQIIDYISSIKPTLLSNIRFQGILKEVYSQEDWSDTKLTIQCQDGEVEVFIIKSLFTAKSEYFKGLFNPQFREGTASQLNNKILLDWSAEFGFNLNDALAILEFFYNENILLNEYIQVVNYFKYAHTLLIIPLQEMCDQWIREYPGLNEDNVLEIYELGKNYGSRTWKQAALSFAAFFMLMNKNSNTVLPANSEENSIQEDRIHHFIKEHALEVEELKLDLSTYHLPCHVIEQILISMSQIFTQLKEFSLISEALSDLKMLINLKHLESLKLEIKINTIFDNYLSFIKKLTKLKKIDLSINVKADKLFSYLKKLQNLETLIVYFDNKLDFKKISQCSYLKRLKYLDISCKELRKPRKQCDLNTVLGLSNLHHLSLPRDFTEEELKEIHQLKHLTSLSLPHGRENLLASLNHDAQNPMMQRRVVDQLEELYIQYNKSEKSKLQPHSLEYLTHYKNLKKLKISQDDFLDDTLEAQRTTARILAQIPQLEELDVRLGSGSESQWLELWIQELEKYDKLDQITSLSNIYLSESQLITISKLTNLKKLHFSSVAQNPLNLKYLSRLTNLEELSINYPRLRLEPDSLHEIAKLFPHLKKLECNRQCDSFNKGYWNIVICNPLKFNFDFTQKIRSLTFVNFLQTNLSDPQFTKEDFKKWLLNFVNNYDLQHLEILEIFSSTIKHPFYDAGDLKTLLAKAKNLKNLTLNQCYGVDSRDLYLTIKGLKKLETLTFCDLPISGSISCLKELTNLVTLDFHFNSKLPETIIGTFISALSFTPEMPVLKDVRLNRNSYFNFIKKVSKRSIPNT